MRFEVEARQVTDTTTAKRINILPSDEQGVFVIQHPHYRQRAVGKLGLAGLSKETVEKIEDGTTQLDTFFFAASDGQVRLVGDDVALAAKLGIDGATNSVTIEVDGFREMAVVPNRDM